MWLWEFYRWSHCSHLPHLSQQQRNKTFDLECCKAPRFEEEGIVSHYLDVDMLYSTAQNVIFNLGYGTPFLADRFRAYPSTRKQRLCPQRKKIFFTRGMADLTARMLEPPHVPLRTTDGCYSP